MWRIATVATAAPAKARQRTDAIRTARRIVYGRAYAHVVETGLATSAACALG
jgi:hypothetical protein